MIYEYRKSRHAGVSERTCYARANQRTRPDPMHVVSFLCEVHLIAARAVNSVLLKKGRRKTHSRHRVCSDYRCSQSTPACQLDPFDVETTLSAMHVKLQCTYAYRSVLRESRDRTLFLSARLSDLPDALLPFPAAVPSCVSVPESSDVSSYTFASRDDEREAASSPLALPRCKCGQHKTNYRDRLKEMAVLLSTTCRQQHAEYSRNLGIAF